MITRRQFVRLVLAAIVGTGAELAGIALIASAAWLIARAGRHPALSALSFAVIAVRACGLARGSLRYAERLMGHDVALRALADLRVRTFAAMALSVGARRGRRGRAREGDLLTGMVSDVEAVQDLLLRCVLPTAVSAAVGVCALGITLWMNPMAGVVLATGLTAAGIGLPVLAARFSWSNAASAAVARAELADLSIDVIRGADDLAAFGATERAIDRAAQAAGRLARTENRTGMVESALVGAGIAVQGLTALGVTWLAMRDGASAVTVTVLALTALVSVEAVLPIADAARRLAELAPSMRRIIELLRRDIYPQPVHKCPAGPVELVRVRLAYDHCVALDGVDLRIPPGHRIAVVGASGAGKSSLLAVLSGETAPDSGLMLVADRDAQSLDVRTAVRGVAQDAHVFATSLRANLTLAKPDATTADLRTAARRAGLLDWIESLPAGWDTPVDAHRISGGQRARLLLARALLADPPVLVLDEPTEGLDVATADALVTDLLAHDQGRSLVMVTHRLAPLDGADEIVVLDEGSIVQRGIHATLIGQPGPYRDLWEAELLGASGSRAPGQGRFTRTR